MPLLSLLHDFRARFPEHGTFPLFPGESIDRAVTKYAVPDRPGAYVVSTIAVEPQVIYIGRAGTMNGDGTWRSQMLAGRLCAKQRDLPRRVFWQNAIAETGANQLTFEWFVTVGEPTILPALAEAQLLQAFYEDHGRLPRYNVCV